MMAEAGNRQKGNSRAHRSEGRRAKGLCEREVKELRVKSRLLCASGCGQQSGWLYSSRASVQTFPAP